MTMSKNAIGNLVNKYRAVLSKSRLLPPLGSPAVAGVLVLGAASGAVADSGINWQGHQGLNNYYAGSHADPGNATGANVYIDKGDSSYSIYGGHVWTKGDATYNSVIMTDGKVQVVGGGYTDVGNANNNKVTVSGGALSNVLGGYTHGGDANNNTVTILGGHISSYVYGGYSTAGGNTIGNMVTISGGDIGVTVYGGYADNGSAENNTVTISGGHIGSHVLGGYSKGNANNNTVSISGGTITGLVCGGFSVNGNANNNTVTYSGGMINGSLNGGISGGGTSINNTLVTIGSRTVVGDVTQFQNYHFVLDAIQNVGLSAGKFTMDGTTNRILGVDALGGGILPKAGDTLTLVKATTALTDGGIGVTAGRTGTGKKGATLLFDYDVAVNGPNNTLEATVSNVRANPQAKALSEGILANAALVNMGADAVAGAGMDSAMAATANSDPAGTTTLAPFGTLHAGYSRINTGSHVNIKALNLIAGIALGVQTDFAKYMVGPFFEAGFGDYKTHNSFDNAASVDGNGTTNFRGAGILSRVDFADIALGHPWLEGSFRFGRASNKYDTKDMSDALGRTVDYDTDASYQSFHVGLGYMFNLTEAGHLDVYGKYFWSHLGRSDVNVLGDPIEFDDVHSSRLRLGARYSHDFGSDKNCTFSPYIGLAYEHEFDGKARATTYGYDIEAPTLKGDTGIGELGVTYKYQNGLFFDLGVSGHVGRRQGVMGNLMLKYEF